MSIRLDPRRLSALKLLAAEAGVRPGELVTRWVEERLDAARSGQAAVSATPPGDELAELSARLDELARRVEAMSAGAPKSPATVRAPAGAATTEPAEEPAAVPTVAAAPAKRRPGRPRKHPEAAPKAPAAPRIPLHEEIAAVIGERGPMTAAEIAAAIAERGRYAAPRSAKPLDAATVNSRVSNPTYRARFARNAGRIGLADRS